MQQIDYPPVQKALERLRGLSADAEIQRLAFVRERALRDERNELLARGRRASFKAKSPSSNANCATALAP